MFKQQENASHRFALFIALCASASGCVVAKEDAEVPETEEQETTADAASAYTASESCTRMGGGTWGAILEMCVTVSADGSGKFTVTKQDGSNFSTAGTMHLKVGACEPWGVDHASATINGSGVIGAIDFSELFRQWPNYPKPYYARWESQAGGYACVGPITIYP